MKYDSVIAVGCSFVHGSAIEDENGRPANGQYRFSKVLSDRLNVPEINLARAGGSNERIFRKIYQYFESDKTPRKSDNPLLIIGLSGLSRTQIYSNESKTFWDFHILDQYGFEGNALKELMSQRAEKFWGDKGKWKELTDWTDKYVRYFYNEEAARCKLQRELIFLDGYLKNKNIDYVIFNSLSNDIEKIKHKLPYISFDFDKSEKLTGDINPLEDSWYHYLRYRHYHEVCKDFNIIEHRSSIPPHGKFFCKGHPSSYAHKELADTIYNKLKTL